VYAWARRAGHAQVVPVKGVDGFNRAAPIVGPSYVDVTEGGRKLRRGARLWTVAVATFKSETYRFLRLSRPTDEELAAGAAYPAGYVHLPRGMEAEWVKQLVAEQLVSVRTKRGFARLEWQKVYNRNEVLDCRVYARAAAWIAGADRWTEATWRDLAKQVAPSGDDVPVPTTSEEPDAGDAPPPSAGVLRRRVPRGRRVFTPSYLR
jgi:phage terminase large subunit GpA-like protein